MTALVLALAALTPGDGGTVRGPDTATVVFTPGAGEWEGTARLGLGEVCEARLAGGRLSLRWPAGRMNVTSPFVITPDREGRGWAVISGRPSPALVRWDGLRLLVCYGEGRPRSFEPSRDTVLLTLKPVSPRKP